MDFVMRPKAATIKLVHPDGSYDLCTSARHLAELIHDEYAISLSKFQATRLCNHHDYKRAKFALPDGVMIQRLNSTKATRRNLRVIDNDTAAEDGYCHNLDQSDDASDDPRDQEPLEASDEA